MNKPKQRTCKAMIAPAVLDKPKPNGIAGGWLYGDKTIKELLVETKAGKCLSFAHAFSRSEIASWYMAAKRTKTKIIIRKNGATATDVWKVDRKA